MDPVEVGPLHPDEREAYEVFLRRQPEATFYHTLPYRDLLLGVLGCEAEYLVARSHGRITGVLPLMARGGPFGRIVNSLPFFGSYGGVVSETQEAAGALWQAFARIVHAPGTAAATIIESPFGAGFPWQAMPESAVFDERIGQYTALSQDADFPATLLKRIDGAARRNIRKAEASGVQVTIRNDAVEFLLESHRENMAEIGGTTKPLAFFETFPRVFRAGVDYDIYVATLQDAPIAALLLFYYKHFVEYFIPTTLGTQRERQPMAAIVYRAMCDAAARGHRIWNWGGTWLSQTGVYRFKRKWAAEERQYRYSVIVSDESLRARSEQELRAAYPYFYVMPFRRA